MKAEERNEKIPAADSEKAERFSPARPGFVNIRQKSSRREGLHHAAIQRFDLFHICVAGIAGTAGVCKSGIRQELNIFFLQNALQVGGNTHISG